MRRRVAGWVLALVAVSAAADSPSPPAGHPGPGTTALSPQDVAGYLAGDGMGLARAAELNGYPGPAHVLELAGELGLTSGQRTETEAIVRRMRARAIELGRQLVEEERALDRLFASRTVTAEALASSTARLGRLQGELRHVHLAAHLEQTALLTPAQIEAYRRLRGHGGGGHGSHEPGGAPRH